MEEIESIIDYLEFYEVWKKIQNFKDLSYPPTFIFWVCGIVLIIWLLYDILKWFFFDDKKSTP